MDLSSDANADFEGLLEGNRGICMPQMAEKTGARRAAELCGGALIHCADATRVPSPLYVSRVSSLKSSVYGGLIMPKRSFAR